MVHSWPWCLLFYSLWVHFCWSSFCGLDFFCSIACECISASHPFSALISFVLQLVSAFLLFILLWPWSLLFYSLSVHFCWSSFCGLDFFCSIACECISAGHPFMALISLFSRMWVSFFLSHFHSFDFHHFKACECMSTCYIISPCFYCAIDCKCIVHVSFHHQHELLTFVILMFYVQIVSYLTSFSLSCYLVETFQYVSFHPLYNNISDI